MKIDKNIFNKDSFPFLQVRNEKGSQKVIMRNVVFAKFDAILAPMAVKIMKEKQIPLLDNDAFFLNILYNQISRSLGPK